jgi:hypothetical protein
MSTENGWNRLYVCFGQKHQSNINICATGNWTFIITFFFFLGHGGSPPQTGCRWCHNFDWYIVPGSSLPHHEYLQTQNNKYSEEKYCQAGVWFWLSKANLRTPTTSYEETDWLVRVPSISRLFPLQDGCVQPNGVLRRVWGPEDFIPFNPCVWHNFGCTTAELYNAPLGHFFFWVRGFQRLYRTQSTPKLTCELMNW